MKQSIYLVFGIIAVLGLIIVAGCTNQQGNVSGNGSLQGKVTIGPLCPVERVPPDPRCQPTEATYSAWPIGVFTPDKKAEVAKIVPSLDGTFKVELPVGSYVVDLEKSQSFGAGSNNLPASVIIKAGESAQLNISIDTGIR